MKPHARRRLALRRVYYDLLNTICQLEQELDAHEAMCKRVRHARANMLRWAKRYRQKVEEENKPTSFHSQNLFI